LENRNVAESDEIVIDLWQIVYVLWKYAVWILLVAVLCADVGFAAAAFVIHPTYSASADMIVNNKQNAATQTGDVTTSDLSASSTLVSTYSVILKSHTVLGQVIDQLGLPYTYDQLAGMISVSTVNNTQVMRITVRCGDSQTALEIVSKLVEIAPRVIVDKAEVGSVKTVDEPWTSGKIVSPSKKKYALAGFAAGFLAMCAIFILRELLNNTYKTEADITKDLGLPVLGVIPLEEGGVVGRSRK
jgi:capsular polysaccharide biosynthesis protein